MKNFPKLFKFFLLFKTYLKCLKFFETFKTLQNFAVANASDTANACATANTTTATTATTTTATPTSTADLDPKTEIMLHCGLPKKVNNKTMNDEQTSAISALSPQLGLDWDYSCVELCLAQLILETL